jgi:hypothetical protein
MQGLACLPFAEELAIESQFDFRETAWKRFPVAPARSLFRESSPAPIHD